MAEVPDSNALEQFVTQVVDHAASRLSATAADAKKRQTVLASAKAGSNRERSNQIKTALAAEDRVALDSRALAKQLTSVTGKMQSDLEGLVTASLGLDG
jgi:hypothetical protein